MTLINAMSGDQKAHPLKQLYFYLTKGCNQKCRHCWIAPEYQSQSDSLPVLEPYAIRSIITQALPLGLSGVKLTGGEPLLHPDISEILSFIRSTELCLSIETNGVLCTPRLAEEIRSSSKMLHVSVSLDGADAATHEWVRGVSGSFDAAINGIENLVKAGIRPQIIMSLIRRNMGHIDSVVKLAQFVGASSVKFNPVQPTARGDQMHNAMETLSVTELVELGNLVVKELSPSSTIPLCFTQPLAFHPLGRILSDEGCGYGVCRITDILGVLADGSYSLCGIGESVPDLVFGHSSEKSLNDVWLNSKVLIELREGLPDKLEGICGECLLKATCNGSCIAQNYYRSRHLWAPFWFCEEAHRLNVFPTSRKMHISNII